MERLKVLFIPVDVVHQLKSIQADRQASEK